MFERFGTAWFHPFVDALFERIETLRDDGVDDDRIGVELLGMFADNRAGDEVSYLAARGLLRLVIHATARDGVEAR